MHSIGHFLHMSGYARSKKEGMTGYRLIIKKLKTEVAALEINPFRQLGSNVQAQCRTAILCVCQAYLQEA